MKDARQGLHSPGENFANCLTLFLSVQHEYTMAQVQTFSHQLLPITQ